MALRKVASAASKARLHGERATQQAAACRWISDRARAPRGRLFPLAPACHVTGRPAPPRRKGPVASIQVLFGARAVSSQYAIRAAKRPHSGCSTHRIVAGRYRLVRCKTLVAPSYSCRAIATSETLIGKILQACYKALAELLLYARLRGVAAMKQKRLDVGVSMKNRKIPLTAAICAVLNPAYSAIAQDAPEASRLEAGDRHRDAPRDELSRRSRRA